jgi:predicted nuclease of predicted toxin-antitoxin system
MSARVSSTPDFLLDENLSWRVARGLRAQGYSVVTTTEARLVSQRDEDVFRYAQAHHLVIITRDSDFRSRFGPPHAGIIVVQAPGAAGNADILSCLLAHLPAMLAQPLHDTVHVIDC